MNWFSTIVRVAGTAFPVTSALVQLQSELDSDALLTRVKKLEDPISFLHEDIPAVSKLIYESLKSTNSASLNFEDDVYVQFSRSFAALDANRHIKALHRLGRQLPIGIDVVDPSYLMYLCALFEVPDKMEKMIKIVDECKVGEWLDGRAVHNDLQLPLPVVKACFDIYDAKGYGLCSRETDRVTYCGKA
jgi:hypothetical protein